MVVDCTAKETCGKSPYVFNGIRRALEGWTVLATAFCNETKASASSRLTSGGNKGLLASKRTRARSICSAAGKSEAAPAVDRRSAAMIPPATNSGREAKEFSWARGECNVGMLTS
jgi:hypothetical protein